jgi:hypothetical protein
MAAVIDATVGGANANAFLTLAEADAINETHPYSAAWAALSDDMRTRCIITATRLLNDRVSWFGTATDETQRLTLPRSGLYDRNLYAIDDDVIHDDLKWITAEFARALAEYDYTADNAAGRDALKRVEVGAVKVEYADDAGRRAAVFMTASLIQALAPYGTVASSHPSVAWLIRT